MRINVYSEEITDEVGVVTKTVTNDLIGTQTFYGIRVFLKSPDVLHVGDDDDRSAITFWVPWTRAGGHDTDLIGEMMKNLGRVLAMVDKAIGNV